MNSRLIFFVFFVLITGVSSVFAYQKNEVTVIGPIFHDQDLFINELDIIGKDFNLRIKYKPVVDPETYIIKNLTAEDSIAIIPNPQGVTNLANRNLILSVNDLEVDNMKISELYSSHLTNIVSYEENMYGGWLRLFPNSLLWFDISKSEKFPELDFTNYELLMDSTKKIADSGISPWCANSESAASTGWIQTNWLEDIILTKHGPEIYDRWSNLEISASNVKIYSSVKEIGDYIFYPSHIHGSHPAIYYREFRNLPKILLDDSNDCFLSWSGHYFKNYIPDNFTYGVDYGVIKLPHIKYQDVVTGIGDSLVLIKNDSNSKIVFQEILSKNFGREWSKSQNSDFISPNRNFDKKLIKNDLTKYEFQIIHTALQNDLFRYDASEIMDRPIGSSLLWKMLLDYMKKGQESLVNLLNDLDKEI